MTILEHLLVLLGEECAEVTHITSKILRFGLEEVNVLNPDGPDNQARLVDELNDLMAIISLLEDNGVLPSAWRNQSAQLSKKYKVLEFARISRRCGTLTGEDLCMNIGDMNHAIGPYTS